MKKELAVLIVLVSLAIAGCVQTPPQATPTPTLIASATPTPITSPIASPVASPTPAASPTPIVSPSVSPNPLGKLVLESNTACGDIGDKTAFIRFTQNSFTITAYKGLGSPCVNYSLTSATVQEGNPAKIVINIGSQRTGDYCIQCVGLATLVLHGNLTQPVSSFVVNLDGVQLASFETSETFCGGIGGFQCPTGYDCKLDGTYPDAGGKCVLKPPATP